MKVPVFLALILCFYVVTPAQAAENAQMHGHHQDHATAAPSATLMIDLKPLILPIVPEEPIMLTFFLQDLQGNPITNEQLILSHTQKIHMMIIDQNLAEYHHLHPQPSPIIKDAFTVEWLPLGPGPYRMFIDTMLTHNQTPIITPIDLGGVFTTLPQDKRALNTQAVIDGYAFTLLGTSDGSIAMPPASSDKSPLLTVQVTKDDQPVTTLEPIMGAFAHLVGFTQDGSQMVHMHPMGPEPTDNKDRGGPHLNFHVMPSGLGRLPLFLQVKINGKVITAPFVINVSDTSEPPSAPHTHH